MHGKLFSTSTGLPIEAKTCRQLLEVAVHDILQEPIYLKKLYTELCAALPPSNEWLLYPFCTNGLASAFKTNPELKIKIQETGAAEGPERNTGLGSEGKSTKIAIVGMYLVIVPYTGWNLANSSRYGWPISRIVKSARLLESLGGRT